MARRERIVERVAAPFAGARVDRDKGVVSGVLICGLESANGRDYTATSFGDGSQYRGRHVYLNHGRERRAEDKVGWFDPASIRFRANGTPEGDFHVLKSHPMAAVILEAAERNPGLFGFSHVAQCRTSSGSGGRVRVEAVEDVESVDLVADPATTGGMFEHRTGGQKVTVKEYLDRLAPRCGVEQLLRVRTLLREDDFGAAPMAGDAPAADDAGTDSDSAIDAAFESAIIALVKQALADGDTKKDVLAKIKKLFTAHGDATDSAGGGSEPEAEEPPMESRGKGGPPALAAVLRECAAARFDAKPHDLIALTNTPAAEDRKAYVEGRLAETKTAEQVRSAGRRPGAGSAGAAGKTQESRGESERLIPKWN